MDKQLALGKYIAGNSYSIADMAIYPWLRNWKNQGIDWKDFPRLKEWFDLIGDRPAVKRGCEVLADLRKPLQNDKSHGNFVWQRPIRQTLTSKLPAYTDQTAFANGRGLE